MPRLKSGRHVCLSISPLLDAIRFGSDTSVSYKILLCRLAIQGPQQLRDVVTVGYFREGGDGAENALAYNSGFTVRDVLEGKAGWSAEEITEFRDWLDTDPRVVPWLEAKYDELDAAIRDSVVWDTPLWTDDESGSPGQEPDSGYRLSH